MIFSTRFTVSVSGSCISPKTNICGKQPKSLGKDWGLSSLTTHHLGYFLLVLVFLLLLAHISCCCRFLGRCHNLRSHYDRNDRNKCRRTRTWSDCGLLQCRCEGSPRTMSLLRKFPRQLNLNVLKPLLVYFCNHPLYIHAAITVSGGSARYGR